jgi:diguanylate cyclase (GGDEF)-like protein
MRQLSLRAKILLLTAGSAVGLAILIMATMAVVSSRQIERDEQTRVRATSALITQVIALDTRAFELEGQLIAREQPVLLVIGTGDKATVKDTADDLRNRLGCDAVAITDPGGKVLGKTNDGVPPDSVSNLDGVKLAEGGDVWSGVARYGDTVSHVVSVPIKTGGAVWGTLTIFRHFNSAMANALRSALGSNTEVAFVDQGKVLGSSVSLPDLIDVPSAGAQVQKFNKTAYSMRYGVVPGTQPDDGIGFVTWQPYDVEMAPYRMFQNAFVVVSILSLIVALLAGRTVSQSVTTPLEGLANAARQVQLGIWPKPVSTRRSDEIGLLQNVFDDMASSVRKSREELEAIIDTDPLTKLDNHRRFQERLMKETADSDTFNTALSLFLVDIDHFQAYNQQFGHTAGDAVLRRIGQILARSANATLARYGGDEFAAILPHFGLARAAEMCETIRSMVEREFAAENAAQPITVSVGYATYRTHSREAEGLLLAAELAVARAKQLGRNQVCGFDNVSGADETTDPSQLQRYLKDGSLATIQALAAAVDAKDPYTKGHSESVARYASQLAEHLNFPADEVELIYVTGTLHDVGKIGVPDAILKKPGRLEADEQHVMQTHPVLGEVIVKKAPQLAATVPGVRHHHERYDGQGYPDRLAGEAIPKIARILAVADTFDAMTSDRPYRKGLPWAIALAEIEKGSGTQFDPEFAAAFVKVMRSKHPDKLRDEAPEPHLKLVDTEKVSQAA